MKRSLTHSRLLSARTRRSLFLERLEDRRVMAPMIYWGSPDGGGIFAEGNYTINLNLDRVDSPGDDPSPVDVQIVATVTFDHPNGKNGAYTVPHTVSISANGTANVPVEIKDDDFDSDRTITVSFVPSNADPIEYGGDPENFVEIHITDEDTETLPAPKPAPKPVLGGCPTCATINRARDVTNGNPSVRPRGSEATNRSFSASGWSSHPVRYSDGTVLVSSADLESSGFGMPWGVTRNWTNGPGYSPDNVVGNGMIVSEQPYLRRLGPAVAVISNGFSARYFDYVYPNYYPRDFRQEDLTYDSIEDEYSLTSSDGTTVKFFGFGSRYEDLQRGQFKSYRDLVGNEISVISLTDSGRMEEVQRSHLVGLTTVTESFLYNYLDAGEGMLESVVLRRRVDAGSWSVVRKVEYAYYDDESSHGNEGDLESVVILDGADQELETTYYRYYKPEDEDGYAHGLKYVVYPKSFELLVQSEGSNLDSIDDVDLAPFADHYFEYDSEQRATKEIAQGAGCSTCSGGQGAFEYSYMVSANADGYNSWHTKTTETLPDGNQNIVFTNYVGQVMLQVFKDTTTSDEWTSYYRYDAAGRTVLAAQPSAVTGYDPLVADLLDLDSGNLTYLHDSEGMITVFEYYDSTTATTSVAGSAAGYLERVSLREGEDGADVPQSLTTYIAATAGGDTTYLTASETVYSDTAGLVGLTTAFAYTLFSGTLMVESEQVTSPAGDVSTVVYDDRGRPIWAKDADGYLHYTAYDAKTGVVVKTIGDVDTTQTGDFVGKPSGWTTPLGGGAHALSAFEVDHLGRVTKLTDPDGRITYTVYDDVDKEVRIYPGWDASTSSTTGPTIVMRDDRANGYSEVLTMSATPTAVSNRPTGGEAISSLKSLSRTYSNDAGQVVASDEYFDLTGVTYSTAPSLGTLNTNYLRTTFAYDSRGRQSKSVRADGTIFRTVFDGQGRPVSEWIGDNDTPVAGYWSPSNPAGMEIVSQYQYDGDNVGDGFVTQLTDALSSSTKLEYDFRGRMTKTTQPDPDGSGVGVAAPVFTFEYDNLGRKIKATDAELNVTQWTYDDDDNEVKVVFPDPDGSGVGASSPETVTIYNGRGLVISEKDANGGITGYTYDGLGRLKKLTQPDPDGPSNPLTSPETLYSYDDSGNVRYITDPLANVTEFQYDKSSRKTKQIAADPDGVATKYSSPETEWAYDAAGQLLSVTDPLDRVTSYEYDALGRVTKVTQPDPDDGGPLSAPVVVYTYDEASRLISAKDPLNNVTTYEYDLYDNRSKLTAPDPDGVGGAAAPVTSWTYNAVGELTKSVDPMGRQTEYTYDALGRLIQVKSPDPDTGNSPPDSPITSYQYDQVGNLIETTDPLGKITTYTYDNLYRRTKEELPDPDGSGNPTLTRPTTTYTYDAVGNRLTLTDPVGNTTSWAYDKLNRVTSETNELNATRYFEYDKAGNLIERTDRLGRVTQFDYDNLYRLTTETWIGGGAIDVFETRKGYQPEPEDEEDSPDPVDERQLFILHNATGGTFTLTFDSNTSSPINFDATALEVQTALNSITIGTGYSFGVTKLSDGRYVLGGAYPEGVDFPEIVADGSVLTNTLTYEYDAAGQLVGAGSTTADYTYTYDKLGRVSSEEQAIAGLMPTVAFASTYDANSRRTQLSATLGSTLDSLSEYSYDNVGRLTQLKQGGQTSGNAVAEKRIGLVYNGAGQTTSIVRHANHAGTQEVATSDYTYDGLGRITSLLHHKSATDFAGYEFGYDAASRILEIDSLVDGLTEYNHDFTGQLIGANHASQPDEAYEYDENGNRVMAGYDVGDNNQLLTQLTPSGMNYGYEYDAEGNRTKRADLEPGKYSEYFWDHRNRLQKVVEYDVDDNVRRITRYKYDHLNQWIGRSVQVPNSGDPIDTYFVHHDGQIVMQFDGDAASDLTHRYLWGPAVDQLLADEQVTSLASAGNVLWPLADHIGTVRDIADRNESTGAVTVTNHIQYNSFGEIVDETNSAVIHLFGFTGRPLDGFTGLQNNLNRWYDSMAGRWISEDPIGFGGGDTSLFRYVTNAIIERKDPSGLAELSYEDALNLSAQASNAIGEEIADLSNMPQFSLFWQWDYERPGEGGNSRPLLRVIESSSAWTIWRPFATWGTTKYNMRVVELEYLRGMTKADFDKDTQCGNGAVALNTAHIQMIETAQAAIANNAAVSMNEGVYEAGSISFGSALAIADYFTKRPFKGVLPAGFRPSEGFATFEDFKLAFGNAGDGHAWHHIVEQTINSGKFAPELLHNPGNLIRIPHGPGTLHAKISGYYSSKQQFSCGMTVREWLSKKSFMEQFAFGVETIKTFGGAEHLPVQLR